MTNCTFCGEAMEQGTGVVYVKNDGKIMYFCASKCKKNQIQLKRKPIHTEWTKGYKK